MCCVGTTNMVNGHHKYGDKCHFRHNNVVCVTENCGVFDCDKRHPVDCKYYRNFRRCKFDNCSYNHGNYEGNGTEEKIKMLETMLKENNDNKKNIVKQLEAFEKTNDEKVKAVEIQLTKMNKIDKEKKAKIADLESKLVELENKFKDLATKKEVEQKINNLETLVSKQQKAYEKIEKLDKLVKDNEKVNIKCPKCDFTTVSDKGLKTHIKKMHEKANKISESKL